ncbi:MAG: hypothetical protein IJP10_01190 [Clostridia bacterium]|nr:hypothetical protein [Oscillospiraceae bacterium]MBQ6796605.1 hypothetical protein [Clostridia bacterium]
MSLFSYIDTRAPSTEEIIKAEMEVDENGNPVEMTWVDEFELQTECSLQKLSSLFGTLSIAVMLIGIIVTGFLAVRSAVGQFSVYSAMILLAGLTITVIVFALMRLARGAVDFMLVRLLQEEEE